MSSTLFNRGMTTQVGLRRRAEEVKKSIDELRSTAMDARALQANIDSIARENTALRALVLSLETRLAALETKPATDNSTFETRLAALETKPATDNSTIETRISALESRPVVTTGALESRVTTLESRVSGLEERNSA